MDKSHLKEISYLGDGAYVGHDGYQYLIFTDNGISQENWVALEPEAIEALMAYVKRISDKYKD